MAQVSRPFQIGIAAVAVLACVWLFALRGHSSSNEPSSSASAPAPAASAPSSGTHASAPGVEGLTKAVEKAHGAVATSERNASELQKQSAAASGEAAGSGSAAGASAPASSATGSTKARSPGSSAVAGSTAVFDAVQRVRSHNAWLYPARANEVASFGALTKSIQVFQTPTLVVVGPDRRAHVVTGLTNPYVVEQTISEARASH
jgi:hypothetical protein